MFSQFVRFLDVLERAITSGGRKLCRFRPQTRNTKRQDNQTEKGRCGAGYHIRGPQTLPVRPTPEHVFSRWTSSIMPSLTPCSESPPVPSSVVFSQFVRFLDVLEWAITPGGRELCRFRPETRNPTRHNAAKRREAPESRTPSHTPCFDSGV